jgi:putative peptide maturation dehydrogenase
LPLTRVRRPRFLCFTCEDEPFVDVERLLAGELEPATLRQLYALSPLTGHKVALTRDDLDLVLSTPADDWLEIEGDSARRLTEFGVLVAEDDETLRARDDRLRESQWNFFGAFYYFLTRWSGVDLRRLSGQDPTGELLPPTGEIIRSFLDTYGPPPKPFRQPHAPLHELPRAERAGQLYDTLLARKTTRSFDREAPLSQGELGIVLHYVFGYHGYAPLFGEVMTLKRTSPSGGGLHPVDAYPLVLNVDGIEPGLYRYDPRAHALELVGPVTREEATSFVCGQSYFSAAQVLVVLAARFERAFWKYREHPRGLAAMFMDAAHLSQTLYLVCTEMGLGAFVTAAINNADLDQRIGLDGMDEGTLAVCGFGRPAAQPSPFDPQFEPLPRD